MPGPVRKKHPEHRGPAKEPGHYGYSRGCRCPGCVEAGRAYHAAYYRRPGVKEKRFDGFRRREYGISSEEYNALLSAQDGGCAICGADSSAGSNGGRRNLCVDHCHETGEVRGLLCNDCNRAIGLLGDNPERVRSALDYLLR